MMLPDIRRANVFGKRVFLRADLDVPIKSQKSKVKSQNLIEDDTRLEAWMPTLKHLLNKGAKVVIAGHLGRPASLASESVAGRPENHDKDLSVEPIAKWLSKKLKVKSVKLKIKKIGEFLGWEISPSVFLLENLRFYKGEEENDTDFSKKLSSLADIYVNDAFSASHRTHASIVGITQYLPRFAGFRLKKEVEVLSKVIESPKRPLVVIVGGAKMETKLPLVEKMHHFADYVLVGGKIAQETRVLLKVQHEKLKEGKSVLLVADLNKEESDITPKSVENFLQVVNLAKTVVWNGPVNKMENGKWKMENSSSAELARGIIERGIFSVVGGGDTVGFLKKLNLLSKFSFVSTGGGAMLEFLSGEKLLGLEALNSNTL